MRADNRIAIVCLDPPGRTETFIQAHVDHLPGNIVVSGTWRPEIGGRPVLSWPRLAAHKAWRMISGADGERQRTESYVRAFRRHQVGVVLAEYGTAGVYVLPACRELGIPLVAHFHGYDASHRGVLAEFAVGYATLFREAAGLVAVSRAMRTRLLALGAPPARLHYNPYGVNDERFAPGSPEAAPPVAVSVGRFTEKKAPQLVLRAFASVHRVCPDARLRMVGDGPLLTSCRQLAVELGIAGAVAFLGPMTPDQVAAEMRAARVFVQHSIEAPSGDCEGTPLAVIEAGASALPVVATLHGGIPDVVEHGVTGYLVAEHDTEDMAARLTSLMRDPALAGALGAAGRRRVRECFSLTASLRGLSAILEAA
jgi:colanic acid/amylovoran biosynthesis glycosyltransferase